MASSSVSLLLLALACGLMHGLSVEVRAGSHLQAREGAGMAVAAEAVGTGPVGQVISLLKEMQATLQQELEEDEGLYDKLSCWCHNNKYEKDGTIAASQTKIADLEGSIESLTASSAELKTQISELEAEVKANKESLAQATALREKQLQEFNGANHDSIQAIENLKAALVILSRHHEGAFPQTAVSFLAVRSVHDTWTEEHEASHLAQPLDEFMRLSGLDDVVERPVAAAAAAPQKFLQQETEKSSSPTAWSSEETDVVRNAMRAASSLLQARHGEGYYPSYSAQSGEIVGILKQLKEQMEGDLAEEQKLEASRAAEFAELRDSKTAEIENGEKMAEKKEDDLANTDNALAEAKEDLGQEQAALAEDQAFLQNLKQTCGEADTNFEARKQLRIEEIKAVAETINILSEDDARDTMGRTYSLLQVASKSGDDRLRVSASRSLRRLAARTANPQLSLLASSVELDSFERVKKAIDDMVGMLKVQQEDEVKKNDYCKSELHSTEMTISKTEDEKADLEAKEGALAASIKELEEGIEEAKAQVQELEVNLQRMSEDRIKENQDFQKTVADQTILKEVLHKALERLAKYYDESLIQRSTSHTRSNAKAATGVSGLQTPPVPQMEYKPSKGAAGVMQMLEKLIGEAQQMKAESTKAEAEAQAAYETVVDDTNGSVEALQKEVVTKTKAKASATKERLQAEADIVAAVKELDGLAKYTAKLHSECDYILKNFGARQTARQEEIQGLQQAKEILSGANLS
mmetsp:Transcript_61663/g.133553  ORF Transcript_61663/g.133553 Transcript_61663/m.133553 type:complete len:752 (-) Transcript_61663:96-2351(-)